MDKFILKLRCIGQDELFWKTPVAETIDYLSHMDHPISSFLVEHCICLATGFTGAPKTPLQRQRQMLITTRQLWVAYKRPPGNVSLEIHKEKHERNAFFFAGCHACIYHLELLQPTCKYKGGLC